MTDIRMGARWCRKEDEELAELAVDLNHNWVEIAQNFEKRSAKMCENRWNQVISLGLIKGKWSTEEDNIIIESMNHGILKWSEIAKRLPGNRVGKQCRERWCNHLDPTLKKTPWTAEEDSIMFREQKQIGNSWTKIALQIPGRSENEVKNRFNSTIRKRKLAETNGKLGFGGPSYTSDEDQDVRNEEQANSDMYTTEAGTPSRVSAKKVRHNFEPHAFRNVPRHPSRGYPSIPQGYSIISLSKDDLKALHIAEKLLKRIVSMDSSTSPPHIVQLMSLLSMTHLNDISSTYSSLNMVPITNIADHEPQTSSSGMTSMASSENESPDREVPDQLRVDTGRNFGIFDQSAIQRLKSKKLTAAFRRGGGGSCLWAPAEDPSESQRFPISASTVGSFFTVEAEADVEALANSCQKEFYSDMQSRSDSLPRSDSDQKQASDISASLPVFEGDGMNTSMWQNSEQETFGKTDGNERDSDGDGGRDGEGDGGGYADGDGAGRDKDMSERSGGSQCSSPFSLFEELTCSSPSWDCFSPAYTPSITAPPSATHSPTAPDGTGALPSSRGPHKKRKFLPINDSLAPRFASASSSAIEQKLSKEISPSSSFSCTNERGSLEDDIVVEALRMLSGSVKSLHKGLRSGASSVSGGYNFFQPSDGCDTDYMSSFSLSDTPQSSRPHSPTRMVLDDPCLVLPGQMDGLKMNSSYFSLSPTPWSSRPESPHNEYHRMIPQHIDGSKTCYEIPHIADKATILDAMAHISEQYPDKCSP